MTKDEAIKICLSAKSTKADLRNTLAYALGVRLPNNQTKKNTESTFNEMRTLFLSCYKEKHQTDYYWGVKDAVALKQLTLKLKSKLPENHTGKELLNAWRIFLEKLPSWYIEQAMSMGVINSKFNEIVAMIKQKQYGHTNSSISNNYKERIVKDLLS